MAKREKGSTAVDHPMMIRCPKCKADIRTKDCGCDSTWVTEELKK